jgi:hypothetical protein
VGGDFVARAYKRDIQNEQCPHDEFCPYSTLPVNIGHMGMTFLQEVLKSGDPRRTENQLTQVFSACFNHSEEFRRRIKYFFGCKQSFATAKAFISW